MARSGGRRQTEAITRALGQERYLESVAGRTLQAPDHQLGGPYTAILRSPGMETVIVKGKGPRAQRVLDELEVGATGLAKQAESGFKRDCRASLPR